MGNVVIVPPTTVVTRPVGTEMTPVVFSPRHPTGDDGQNLYASVSQTKIVEMNHDPMAHYSSLINFGYWQVGAKMQDKAPSGVSQPMTISYGDLRKKFWDFAEIRDFVRTNFEADLLVQYYENTGMWAFFTCCSADYAVWNVRLSQHKAVEFALDYRLKSKIEQWLRTECGIFDLMVVHGYGSNHSIRVYIKDDDEALHFKLRWYGVDVEKELDEST